MWENGSSEATRSCSSERPLTRQIDMTCPACGDAAAKVKAVLTAALPHLLTEVKSMCETAAAVALKLGRQEALTEIADEMAVEQDDERLSYVTLQTDRETWGILQAAKTSSQPPGAASNGPTASSRHPDTPEDTKPPREAL